MKVIIRMVKINNMLKSSVADRDDVDIVKDTGGKKKMQGVGRPWWSRG